MECECAGCSARAHVNGTVMSVVTNADTLHLVVTHANCYDGAACSVVLQLFCEYLGLPYKTVPHVLWGRTYAEELGKYISQPERPVRLLLFDVSPDDELVNTVLQQPHLSMVVGDHHEGNRGAITRMLQRAAVTEGASSRLMVIFDTAVAGVQLAWRWAAAQLSLTADIPGSLEMCKMLGVPADATEGMCNRVLNVIALADLNVHWALREHVHADAAIRMLWGHGVEKIRSLICARGAYASLQQPGELCARIRGMQARDLLARGRTYFLIPTVVEMLNKAGAGLTVPCTVFYVQGTPHLTAEMAEQHISADMVWIWSKNERAHKKKYVVSVRRGKPSSIRCDVVTSTLCGGGNGHDGASGMAFEREPIDIFATAP